VLSIGQYVK